MAAPAPIFATDRTAAKLLDMKPAEFRELVEAGALPGPRKIGDLDRWDVDELRRIVSGEAVIVVGSEEDPDTTNVIYGEFTERDSRSVIRIHTS